MSHDSKRPPLAHASKGSKVLYAHLGGAPAINGYAYSFRNG
jgi:1-aminocyclopropane-1-carboxylate deaminase